MPKLGIRCKLYYNSATYATPTWAAVNLVADANVNFSWDEGDGTTRASRLKMGANTIANLEVTGTIRTEVADTAFAKLRDAAISDLTVDFLVLNGSTTENDSDGFRFDGRVTNWAEAQGMSVVAFKSFTIKPAISANLPKAAKVTAGAPVFEDIGDQA